MPKILIRYPNEIFGAVTVRINDVLIDSIKKNEVINIETFKGENTITVYVTGTTYEESKIQVDIDKDTEFYIDGFFSRKRFRSYLRIWSFYGILLSLLYFYIKTFSYSLLIFFILLSLPFLGFILFAINYFFFRKNKYIYLIKKNHYEKN